MGTVDTTIEQLRERYNKLSHKKTEAETNLKNAEKHLKELQVQAQKEHGTSDLAKLRKKLAEMEAENERQTLDYQKHLDEIETKLEDIESDPRVPATTSDEAGEDSDYDPFAEE